MKRRNIVISALNGSIYSTPFHSLSLSLSCPRRNFPFYVTSQPMQADIFPMLQCVCMQNVAESSHRMLFNSLRSKCQPGWLRGILALCPRVQIQSAVTQWNCTKFYSKLRTVTDCWQMASFHLTWQYLWVNCQHRAKIYRAQTAKVHLTQSILPATWN